MDGLTESIRRFHPELFSQRNYPTWVGPDIEAASFWIDPQQGYSHDRETILDPRPLGELLHLDRVVVFPGQSVNIELGIHRDSLPPSDLEEFVQDMQHGRFPDPEIISYGFNVRSCLAQSGLVCTRAFITAPEFGRIAEQVIGNSQVGRDHQPGFIIQMVNYGTRPLILKKGDRICRMERFNVKDLVCDGDLKELISNGGIIGEEGVDWGFIETEEGVFSVWIAYDNTSQYDLGTGDEPVHITGRAGLYENQVSRLRPSLSDGQSFAVTRTKAHIYVPPGYIGKLSTNMICRTPRGNFSTNHSIHIPSLVLDPGTNFCPMVELLTQNNRWTLPGGIIPDAVTLSFFRYDQGNSIDPKDFPYERRVGS